MFPIETTWRYRCCAVAGDKYSPTWLEEQGLEYVVYQNVDITKPYYYYNEANEAGAYLQFTVDFYDCLPEVRQGFTTQHNYALVKSLLYRPTRCPALWVAQNQLVQASLNEVECWAK